MNGKVSTGPRSTGRKHMTISPLTVPYKFLPERNHSAIQKRRILVRRHLVATASHVIYYFTF